MAALFLKALILLIHPEEEINSFSQRFSSLSPMQVEKKKKKQLVSRNRDTEKLQ